MVRIACRVTRESVLVAFSLPGYWVWDFWLADTGDIYHLYYLHAPTALGHADLRHANARIGHATSTDLKTWTNHGQVLAAGAPGDFDETATWTGSVVRGGDGLWRMFYTGAKFLVPGEPANVQTIGVATSPDLFNWTKQGLPLIHADPRWYETLNNSRWHEEAWRDPWVFFDIKEHTWHMLVTARANHGDDDNRGVVGHATSPDLDNWTVRPPLSGPDAGFGHLEVLQTVEIDGHGLLVFSCEGSALAQSRVGQNEKGAIWIVSAPSVTGPFAVQNATTLDTGVLYSGKMVQTRNGQWVLLAFNPGVSDGPFEGSISAPLPVNWDAESGRLRVAGIPRSLKEPT